MHRNHPVELYSNKFIWQKLNYIHNNPVRSGLVKFPEEYRYSSAANYAGQEALLDVEILTTKWKTYT